MKILVLTLALSSPAALASDCGRVLGTPGFVASDAVMVIAKAKALGDCEGYQFYKGAEGSCSDTGCVKSGGEFTCTAQLIVCR